MTNYLKPTYTKHEIIGVGVKVYIDDLVRDKQYKYIAHIIKKWSVNENKEK